MSQSSSVIYNHEYDDNKVQNIIKNCKPILDKAESSNVNEQSKINYIEKDTIIQWMNNENAQDNIMILENLSLENKVKSHDNFGFNHNTEQNQFKANQTYKDSLLSKSIEPSSFKSKDLVQSVPNTILPQKSIKNYKNMANMSSSR